MDDFERELKIGFLDEAGQSIADTEQCFLALETDPSNTETLNKIFRLAHNLKGSSKAVGFDQMGALTHEFETFILKIKNGELQASPAVTNLLLKCNDFIGKMISSLKSDLATNFEIDPLIEELKGAANLSAEPAATEPSGEPENTEVVSVESMSVEPEINPLENSDPTPEVKLEVVSELAQQPAAVTPVAPVVSEAPAKSASPAPPSSGSKPSGGGKPAVAEESIRVNVSKVESLLNFIGEMVILQSVIKEQALKTESVILKKTLHQLEKVTKEIQDISMSLRMVPVKPTFQKMQRIVRDTAQSLGKDVFIELRGEDTELDKTVLEKINDPLVHLIRNSVDHGIEKAEIRQQRGKPTRGTVVLAAYQKSGKLFIDVIDDGGGLDAEKLTKKAVEKGLLKADQKLTEEQAFQLIFAPGFSTKEVVTDVSGRGVGMDVVRTNILDLSGEIHIHSKLGQGTTFQIILPLTLAIIDGMTLTYGMDRYVIPFSHVFETLRPTQKDIQINTALGQTLMLRGENMPIFRLGDFFGKKSDSKLENMIAMVIRTSARPFALLVDDILGLSQVVVKQLGPELQGFKGISGCTILGDGKPALILEPSELIKRKLSVTMPAEKSAEKSIGGKAA